MSARSGRRTTAFAFGLAVAIPYPVSSVGWSTDDQLWVLRQAAHCAVLHCAPLVFLGIEKCIVGKGKDLRMDGQWVALPGLLNIEQIMGMGKVCE